MTDVRLSISVDANQGRSTLQQFQAGYTALVNQLRQPLGQISSLRDLQSSLVENDKQLNGVRDKLRQMAGELVNAERPTKAQMMAYRATTLEAKALEQAIAGQKVQLGQLTGALKAAGVDTSYLANEQKRLAADLAQATRAADQQARIAGAREALGIRPHREVRQEISQLQAQYQQLQRSGLLTTAELAQAKVRLRERVADLELGTNGWAHSLSQVRLQAGASIASMGAMLYAGGNLLNFYAQYAQRMGEVNSITDLSQTQLQALSGDVRQLSQGMGRDATQSAAALYDILSSGVSTDNSIAVLEQSTKAAVAGVTDTATAVRGGLAVVNAYGEGIENLGLRYDQMFLTVKDGVTTFPELANFIGDVLPTANAAGVEFGEVAAAIALMTKAGIRTPQATTALKGAINALAAPTDEAKKKLNELGIEWRGLTGTLEDIASRNLGIEVMRQILPDVEARTAVLALTQNMSGMRAEVEAMASAGGSLDQAYAKMAATPQAELDKLNAAWVEMKLQLGESAAAFLPVINWVTSLVAAFNDLPGPLKQSAAFLVAFTAFGLAARSAIVALRNPMGLLLGHLSQVPPAAGGAAQGLGTVAAGATDLIPKLRTLADVAKLAKGALALGVVSWTAGNLMELYDLYEQNQQLEQSQRDYEKSLQDTITATEQYADTVILPAAVLERMTEAERKAYAERLRLAEEHYRKQAELQSRKDMQENGSTAPVSDEALASARRAREFANAQRAIEDAHAEREAAESRHKDALDKIKADQLKQIQDKLAEEIRAYDSANKKLEQARKQRETITKEFEQLAKDMRAPADDKPSSLSDVFDRQSKSRQALQAGDNDEAIRQAREAAAILRELKESGANSYGFAGIADQLAALAGQAAKNQEQQAQAEVDSIKVRMDDLLAKAEAFKRINIEFTGFEQSAAALEAQAVALAERLKQYMVIPVNYVGADAEAAKQQAAADAQAGELVTGEPIKRATGGWIDGPGSPTSDSIQLLGSRNEYMIQARAAMSLGAANLDYMNRTGQLPAASTGLVPEFPSLPSLERTGERQPLNLNMPWGGSYALHGSPSEVQRFSDDLERARIKFGDRR